MVNIAAQLGAVDRGIRTTDVDGVPSYVQTLSQSYPSPIDDVWEAVTTVERIGRWFLPVSGDLENGFGDRPEHALVTSLPDVSELPAMGVPAWRSWFVDTVALACSRVAPPAVAIFYQTDIKHGGRWIDKAYLVHRGAEQAGLSCLWHKIV